MTDEKRYAWLLRHIVSWEVHDHDGAGRRVSDRHERQMVTIKVSPYGPPSQVDREFVNRVVDALIETEEQCAITRSTRLL